MPSSLSLHPLQSDAWGEFRNKTGVSVFKPAKGFQMTVHKIPRVPYAIGYVPKCFLPIKDIIKKLCDIGAEKRCIFIKLEPNILCSDSHIHKLPNFIEVNDSKILLKKSPHPLFTKNTFLIDLTKSEDELLKACKPKTRYNIKIAQKHGVSVQEESTDKALNEYILLSKETWKRQKFHAHGEAYHRLMWETMKKEGIVHLLTAKYVLPNSNKQEVTLTAWILFLYKNVLYYPYGSSSSQYRNVMASNLMMWEAIRWGKKQGATCFDLWGSLGPKPDRKIRGTDFTNLKKVMEEN